MQRQRTGHIDLSPQLGALCAVLVLFAWSEWRLGKMPQTEEEFQKHRTAEYLLLSGVFMITGSALVFALKSGFLAVLIITYLSGGMLFLGCVFFLVVALRVSHELAVRKRTDSH